MGSPESRPFFITRRPADNMVPFLDTRAMLREFDENIRSYNELVVGNEMYKGQIVAVLKQKVIATTSIHEFDSLTFLKRVKEKADELGVEMGSMFISAPQDRVNHQVIILQPSPLKYIKTPQDKLNETFFDERVSSDPTYRGQWVFVANGEIVGSGHIQTPEEYELWESRCTEQARLLGAEVGFVGFVPFPDKGIGANPASSK